jgi:NAD dependent epimerase/dehydratase family enzyme
MAVTQRQFQHGIATSLHRPLLMRVPAFALRWVLGEMAQLFVDGQHVVPRRAVGAGFTFRYRELSAALENLLAQSPTRAELERPRAVA